MEATSLRNDERGGSTSGSYPEPRANDSPRHDSASHPPYITNPPYPPRRSSRSSQRSTASQNPLKNTWRLLLGTRSKKGKAPEAASDATWAAYAPTMQPTTPITFLTSPTLSRAEVIHSPIPTRPAPSPPTTLLPTIPQSTSPYESQVPVSPVDFTTARSRTRTSGISSRSTTNSSRHSASKDSSPSPTISIGQPVHHTALSPSQMSYKELVEWLKEIMVTEVSWMADKAGVEYYNYVDTGNQLYANFVLEYEAKNRAATMWNRAHPDQQIPVPAKWITAETPPTTLPPPTPRQAQTFPALVPRPFAAATGAAASGSGPVPPTQLPAPPARTIPTWNLPRFPLPLKPPTPPAPWILTTGNTSPYDDLKPKILKDVENFKGVSLDISRFFSQCEMHFNLYNRHFRHHPHQVLFCISRFEGEAQVWWDLQSRALGQDADGFQLYPAYADFKTQTRKRFWKDSDARIKGAQWEKLRQANYADRDLFFQKFEELALEAGVLYNEQLMYKQIEKAARETSKNTIFAVNGNIPTTYDEWKQCLLHMDYNFRVRKAEGQANPSTRSHDRTQKTNTPQKGGQMTTTTPEKKTNTGTTYGGQGAPMDTEVKEEKTESKVEEVKDAAENGRTYALSVEHDKYAHSNTTISSSQTPKESHNRYAALTVKNSDEDNDEDNIQLQPRTHGCDAGDAAAAMGDAGRWDPYAVEGQVPLPQDLKLKALSPPWGGLAWENLKGPSQPPARAQAKVASNDASPRFNWMKQESTGHGTEGPHQDHQEPQVRLPIPVDANQRQGDAPAQRQMTGSPSAETSQQDGRTGREMPLTRTTLPTPSDSTVRSQTSSQSSQTVSLVEVPDEEDDTSFKCWLATVARESPQNMDTSPEETQPTVARPMGLGAKVEKVPIVWTWMKPFTAEWMQRAI
ncbi:hypothetical protein ARMSODRAFT_1023546 [Armillaria solidipes]|uniref:Retrotransposon gag domain-containing protein n=1 Tax=Armillaria solidipes TaxID=1076256 RepID=A0A2H3B2F0_9AGAR|nr:hypothetical protein ARMSODRAFT_1023546 [Armillaria solidipes]